MMTFPVSIRLWLLNKKTLLLLTVALLFIAFVTFHAYCPFQEGPSPVNSTILIKRGEGLSQIAAKLERQHLIRSKLFFKWFSIFIGTRKRFRSGEYSIKSHLSVMELIRMLEKGSVTLLSVTIPEGLRYTEVFQLFKKAGFSNTTQYERLCLDKKFITSFKLPFLTISLEGLIFPETYTFEKDIPERSVIKTMVNTFKKTVPTNYGALANKHGLTYYQAIILASIIEKETSVGHERRKIASVFHNRLHKGMLLQTDPTVIYGIKNFDGNLTRKQLKTLTPYNTYMRKGLPPTPISNPGKDSLIAAVDPENTRYLFFVAKGDGTHQFSVTYRDHLRAVRRYQKKRKKNYKSY